MYLLNISMKKKMNGGMRQNKLSSIQSPSSLGSSSLPSSKNLNTTSRTNIKTVTQTPGQTQSSTAQTQTTINSSKTNTANTIENKLESNIETYKIIIIIVFFILILAIIGYFCSFSYRQSKTLYELEISKSFINVQTKINTREHRDKKLCDFYVSSAYRPYLVKNQLFDYCSLEVLKNILIEGVRCVYLDVFNSSLSENAYPIVTSGFKEGEWKLALNSLNFEDVCVTIASIVFSNGYVNNFNDPFILCLNLNTNGNVKCLNKIKKILYKIFKSNLLSNNYTFSSQNMAEVKIKELLGKVIIFTSDGYQNSQLEELVNYSWNKQEINKISYKSLDPMIPDSESVKYNLENLKDFNKNNISMVVPNETSWLTKNYNPEYAWTAGCQLVFINFNTHDTKFDQYLTKFRNDSFLPKPSNMISVIDTEKASINRVISDTETNEDEDNFMNCPLDVSS